MSLPIGAISMTDIATGYGRGAAGTSGFRNYFPYALGEYYRGGQYVPLYDNSSPFGTRATSQSNVDMNTLRGSGGYTHYSNIVAGTNGSKVPAIGYTFGAFGSIDDRTVKCYHPTAGVVAAAYTIAGAFYFTLGEALAGQGWPQNNGWYSIQVINVNGTTFNSTFLRTSATAFNQGSSTTGNTYWYWSAPASFVAGTTYNIRVRLTSIY
jgi:hypothetical protein